MFEVLLRHYNVMQGFYKNETLDILDKYISSAEYLKNHDLKPKLEGTDNGLLQVIEYDQNDNGSVLSSSWVRQPLTKRHKVDKNHFHFHFDTFISFHFQKRFKALTQTFTFTQTQNFTLNFTFKFHFQRV